MNLTELYNTLNRRYGRRADPDTWWPIFWAKTEPPEFERAISNILVQQTNWRTVRTAIDELAQRGLPTAAALATAEENAIAASIKVTGLQNQKATRLKSLGRFVVDVFRTESAFCRSVTREQLLGLRGIGEETADRMLLYVCGRLAWPVDTYCLWVLSRYEVIEPVGSTQRERRLATKLVKSIVAVQMPRELDDWRRLHALMQLEGESIRGS